MIHRIALFALGTGLRHMFLKIRLKIILMMLYLNVCIVYIKAVSVLCVRRSYVRIL